MHNFTLSPPPLHLAFAFSFLFFLPFLYKNSISDSCTGWEKCDALPTVCSAIASEPQWGLEPLPAALLTSGNLDASLRTWLWLLQLRTIDAFDLLFVWKQREACGPAPLCPAQRTHSPKKLLFVRVCDVCAHAFDSCSYVEDSSLKSTEITLAGSVSEGAFQTSTTRGRWGRVLLHFLHLICINECNFNKSA